MTVNGKRRNKSRCFSNQFVFSEKHLFFQLLNIPSKRYDSGPDQRINLPISFFSLCCLLWQCPRVQVLLLPRHWPSLEHGWPGRSRRWHRPVSESQNRPRPHSRSERQLSSLLSCPDTACSRDRALVRSQIGSQVRSPVRPQGGTQIRTWVRVRVISQVRDGSVHKSSHR